MVTQSTLRIVSILIVATMGYVLYVSHWENIKFTYFTINPNPSCGNVDQPCMIGERSYNVVLPRGEGPFPAVLYLHGSNGSGEYVIQDFNVTRSFLENGYAVIAPSALDVVYIGGRTGSGWVWGSHEDGRDDYAFVRNVLDDASARFSIQAERTVIAGHSRGASFVWYLACAGFDTRVRHFAPVNGTPQRSRLLSCADTQAEFNLLHTHGAFDRVVPMVPSILSRSSGLGAWLGARETVDLIVGAAGCEEIETGTDDEEAQTLGQYMCASGTQLRLDRFLGGHVVPAGWSEKIVNWHQETQ